jgi:hypothetical protein
MNPRRRRIIKRIFLERHQEKLRILKELETRRKEAADKQLEKDIRKELSRIRTVQQKIEEGQKLSIKPMVKVEELEKQEKVEKNEEARKEALDRKNLKQKSRASKRKSNVK